MADVITPAPPVPVQAKLLTRWSSLPSQLSARASAARASLRGARLAHPLRRRASAPDYNRCGGDAHGNVACNVPNAHTPFEYNEHSSCTCQSLAHALEDARDMFANAWTTITEALRRCKREHDMCGGWCCWCERGCDWLFGTHERSCPTDTAEPRSCARACRRDSRARYHVVYGHDPRDPRDPHNPDDAPFNAFDALDALDTMERGYLRELPRPHGLSAPSRDRVHATYGATGEAVSRAAAVDDDGEAEAMVATKVVVDDDAADEAAEVVDTNAAEMQDSESPEASRPRDKDDVTGTAVKENEDDMPIANGSSGSDEQQTDGFHFRAGNASA